MAGCRFLARLTAPVAALSVAAILAACGGQPVPGPEIASPTPRFGGGVSSGALEVHEFTLPDAHGGTISLSQFRGDKVVVLAFYRAWW